MDRIAPRIALALAFTLALTLSAHAAEPAGAVLLTPGELKWTDDPAHPGVKVAAVQGDPNTGPAHFFVKLPAGMSVPMHFHTADHWVAVVSGTLVLMPEGGAEKRLATGSGFGFTDKKKHTTKCAEGADCVLFVDARGKWDVVPAEAPAKK